MNMKYSLVFIIVLGLLCGCVRQRKADASDTGSIEMTQSETDALTADSVPLQGAEGTSDSLQGPGNAIYYWKTVFRLTEYDRQFLKKHHIRKIYLRMFDVDYGENMDGELEVLPFATTLFQDTIPAGIEIVPTVYITTKAIRQDADFAEAMYKRIRAMMTRHHIRNVREVQVDCDWTAKTQKAFFRLCQRLHRQPVAQRHHTPTPVEKRSSSRGQGSFDVIQYGVDLQSRDGKFHPQLQGRTSLPEIQSDIRIAPRLCIPRLFVGNLDGKRELQGNPT